MRICVGKASVEPARLFCIGRNYVAHAEELNNEIPERPVIFCKPSSCLVPEGSAITFPAHGKDLHYEAELVILIGRDGWAVTDGEARSLVAGISLGLDLTLRDVQKQMINKGLPWELAKSFEQSAPIGSFVPLADFIDLVDLNFTCIVNGELRQEGNTGLMIFPVTTLIIELSKIWKLVPGDMIFTGTPAGVGPLSRGDKIEIASKLIGSFSWKVA